MPKIRTFVQFKSLLSFTIHSVLKVKKYFVHEFNFILCRILTKLELFRGHDTELRNLVLHGLGVQIIYKF